MLVFVKRKNLIDTFAEDLTVPNSCPFCISYKLLCWGRTHSGEEAVQPSPLSIKLNCKGCRWDVSDSSSWFNYTITINPVSHKKTAVIGDSFISNTYNPSIVRNDGSMCACKAALSLANANDNTPIMGSLEVVYLIFYQRPEGKKKELKKKLSTELSDDDDCCCLQQSHKCKLWIQPGLWTSEPLRPQNLGQPRGRYNFQANLGQEGRTETFPFLPIRHITTIPAAVVSTLMCLMLM